MFNISIRAEPIFFIDHFPFTNSLLLSLLIFIVFIYFALSYKRESKKTHKNTFFYLMTFVVRSVYTLFESIFGEQTKFFFPLVGAFFFFILLQNWSGLIPGIGSVLIRSTETQKFTPLLRGSTADLNTPLALALITFVYTQYIGVRYLGLKEYIGKFINFSHPMMLFVGVLEIVTEFSRIISFSFRLFGNIFAGEVLLSIIGILVPILASFPFLLLEIFVGIVQALVFSMLSAVLFKLAITRHH